MKSKIKKIGLSLFAALLIPTSALAVEGESLPENEDIPQYAEGWQTPYNKYLYFSQTQKSTSTIISDGGSFRACVSEVSVSGATGIIEFYEEDPGTGDDDFIGWGHFKNGNCVVASVGAFADGDNNKPEIYANVGSVFPSTYARLKLQD